MPCPRTAASVFLQTPTAGGVCLSSLVKLKWFQRAVVATPPAHMPVTRSQARKLLEAKGCDNPQQLARIQKQFNELIQPVDHTNIILSFHRQFTTYIKHIVAAETHLDHIAPLTYMLEHLNLNLDNLDLDARLKISLIVHKHFPFYVAFCSAVAFPDLKERLQAALDRTHALVYNFIYWYPQGMLRHHSHEWRTDFTEAYAQASKELSTNLARRMRARREADEVREYMDAKLPSWRGC
jgi:hypothetical protein